MNDIIYIIAYGVALGILIYNVTIYTAAVLWGFTREALETLLRWGIPRLRRKLGIYPEDLRK